MKKLVIASLLIIFAATGFAQTTPAKDSKTKPKTAKTSKTPATTAKTATTPKTGTTAAMGPKTTTTAPKTATAAAGPTKKDGTPDMRYKANRTPPPQHLKKDGTPDMRYKENKAAKTN